jgi:hypothetical protein
MNGFRVWIDIALVTVTARYKWILGAAAVIAVVAGGLYAVGALAGGDAAGGALTGATESPTAVPTAPPPTAVVLVDPTPIPTPVNTPAPRLLPTVAPVVKIEPTPLIEPTPAPPQVVQVPINLRGASQVGSLELVLSYEPSLLEFSGVANGDLAMNAIIESRVSAPGKVWVGMIDAQGLTGDGAMVIVSFRTIKGTTANSPLLLEEVSGYNANTLIDLISSSSPGLLAMYDGSYTAPVVAFH